MDLVIFPFQGAKKWASEGWRTRDAHLVEHFQKDPRIGKMLVVERPVSLAEIVVKRQDWRAPGTRAIAEESSRALSQLGDKTYCLDSKLPDFLRVAREKKAWWFSALENPKTIEAIKWAMAKLGIEKPVLLLQNPMSVAVVPHLGHSLLAFDAIDNWLHHPQMKSNHEQVVKSYEFIRECANVITTVSKALADDFSDAHTKSVNWIPNGVDPDFFAPARHAYEGGPITVGYMGKIQDRVDFDLVRRCLETYSDISFKFIGPAYSQQDVIDGLKRSYANISFTGDVRYENLPEALQEVDFALIPHKVDEFTASMNPLKLYEYLAAGKPVVSTSVAGVSDISDFVKVAGSPDTFVKFVGEVAAAVRVGCVNPAKVAASIPSECTWEHRAGQIVDCLEAAVEGAANV